MQAIEILLLGLLTVAAFAVAVMAGLLGAALTGRGPLYRRIVAFERSRAPQGDREQPGPRFGADSEAAVAGIGISPSVRLLTRGDQTISRERALLMRRARPSDEELDQVIRGSFAAETFNRALRVLAWSFILAVMAVVAIGQLWQPVEPEILITLTLAGAFVLMVHEVIPSDSMGGPRILLEASGTIVFLTALVLLTGNAISPFFFIYPLLVGGAALIAKPPVTVALTLETAVAYGIAATAGWLDGDSIRDSLVRVGINIAALVLLVYAGIAIARVQRRTREAAIRLSTIDSMTELYNRGYFFNSVEREMQRSRRFRRGFCLLMMDLDGLKGINDRFGHYQGDLVLRAVANVIRSGLRAVDVPARYGGDEFVALLPETEAPGAYLVAEKIRQGVSALVVESNGQTIPASLSIGLVSFPEDGETADALMIAADQAMYSSKRLGKNRVVGYANLTKRSRAQQSVLHPILRDTEADDSPARTGRLDRDLFTPVEQDVDVRGPDSFDPGEREESDRQSGEVGGGRPA